MRFLLLLITMPFVLLAQNDNYLNVKDSDVSIKINGEKKILKRDTALPITGGDSICFLEGEGRIVIKNQKQLNKYSKECYIIPVDKDFDMKNFIHSMKEKVYVAYFDSSETIRHGSSAKGTAVNADSQIVLGQGQDLVISSDRFGPLPVQIKIYDENNNLLDTLLNTSESVTFLRLNYFSLKNGYKLEIYNGFNQKLMVSKIELK